VANVNRQYGADTRSLGRNKATVMAEMARAINPDVEVRVFPEAIPTANVAAFLDDVDLLVDGIDFFAVEARRLLFQEARRRGIWAIAAGPVGCSTAWLSFSPTGMSFDRYFDIHSGMERLDQLVAFAVGLTPRATHLGYMDDLGDLEELAESMLTPLATRLGYMDLSEVDPQCTCAAASLRRRR